MNEENYAVPRLNGATTLLESACLKAPPTSAENGVRDSCCSSASSSSSNGSAASSPPTNKNGARDADAFKAPSAPTRFASFHLELNTACQFRRCINTVKKRSNNCDQVQLDDLERRSLSSPICDDELTAKLAKATTSGEPPDKNVDDETAAADCKRAITPPPSATCINARKYFSRRFPKLPERSVVDAAAQLFDEMVIDDYELLLFASFADYKVSSYRKMCAHFCIRVSTYLQVFKAREDEVLVQEQAAERQRKAEEELRIAEIKKKSRKTKVCKQFLA